MSKSKTKTIPYAALSDAARMVGVATSTLDSAGRSGAVDTVFTTSDSGHGQRLYCVKSLKRWDKNRPGKGGRPKGS